MRDAVRREDPATTGPEAGARPLTWRAAVLVLGLAVLVVCARVLHDSHAQHTAAIEAEAAGDLWGAAVRHERALHAWLPGNPWAEASARALERIAADLDGRGDAETALEVDRMLRSGVLSVRSLWQPMGERLAASEVRIARRMAADPKGIWPDPALPRDAREAALLANLRERRDPHPGWVVALELGFLAWVGGAAMFALRAWRPAGFDRGAAWRWGAVVVCGYALWLAGMARA